MKESDDDLRQAIALFRYGVIADLVHLPLGAKGVGDRLREKASQPYAIPGTDRTRVAADTMRDWIRHYRDGGFEALYPKPRTDRGKPRRLPPEVAERLVALKADNPSWPVRAIIRAAAEEGIDHPLAPSTVHRLLSREGLFDRKPPDGADRRRFAFKDAGELWMSDVMHGPKVRFGRGRRKTYLIAFIDDATTGNVLDTYKAIGWELGLSVERSRSSAHHAIRTEISRLAKEARQLPVLVVDEAHHLRNDVLEDLRLLTNFAMDSENRMCLILVGLTELRRRLSMAVHESLSQRLVVRHHLTGLERDEVDAYLTHRLRLAGCELPLFEEAAVEALFQGTRGLPRQINRIAHYALSAAALDKAKTVDANHIQAALDELQP